MDRFPVTARSNVNPDMTAQHMAGIDEAGRGPLAGPVVAAAVILDPNCPIDGLADSKTLSPPRREALAIQIRSQAFSWCVAEASVEEIDRLNILQATLLAMQRAVDGLSLVPAMAWVDGNQAPRLVCPVRTIIRGDATVPAISAASILAKVTRDAIMLALHDKYPDYGFATHKGYPTRSHLSALDKYGISAVHRRSYAPIRQRSGY